MVLVLSPWRVWYLRCSRVTAGRGGTTGTAGRASLRPSLGTEAAAPAGTEGTAPGLGSGGPGGSKEPEDERGRGFQAAPSVSGG